MKKYTLRKPEYASRTRIDYESALNDEQLQVVRRGDGPALVIAGAGSGKTRTITYRVAWLIEHGVRPEQVMLMTFTNRAAREMLRRVEGILEGQVRKVWGGTFHHLGNRILRTYGERLGFSSNFSILDRADQKDMMQVVLASHGVKPTKQRFPRASVLVNIVSAAINTQANISDVVDEKYPYFNHAIEQIKVVAKAFRQRKRELGVVDFDDLLLLWKQLLESDDEVLQTLRSRFKHILVDEYQDTNKLQADIVDLLGAPAGNVMVVGDDCQSIYSFRGANFGNILTFADRYPGVEVHRLETNYRSVPEILELANHVIEHNTRQYEKHLHPVRESSGEKPAVVACRDVSQQAQFIVQRILDLRDEGESLEDMAVLYRAHSHSLELQVELARAGVPYAVRSGVRFFEQAHIKDILAHLRIVENPADELSWNRVVRLYPRIGSATARAIWSYVAGAADAGAVVERLRPEESETVVPKAARESWSRIRQLYIDLATPPLSEDVAASIDYIAGGFYTGLAEERFNNAKVRLEDLQQLAAFAGTYPSPSAFLSETVTLTDLSAQDIVETPEDIDETLALSTVHRAKGLEWGTVFVLWMAEGKFPSFMATDSLEGEEEERRLFYVAVTRAKNLLHLTYPLAETLRDGRDVLTRPSRFIQEIPSDACEQWSLEED